MSILHARPASIARSALLSSALAVLSACSGKTCTGFEAPAARDEGPLQRVVDFGDRQATGVAVSRTGRLFVCFPDWSALSGIPRDAEGPVLSVAEVLPDGTLAPYPSAAWNDAAGPGGAFMPQEAPTLEGLDGRSADASEPVVARTLGNQAGPMSFINVQSVFVDDLDRLWVLDNACPNFAGVRRERGGPKLVLIDLKSNQAVTAFFLDDVAPSNAYLNDVRIDTRNQTAFITDSGAGSGGAIVVVELATNKARRVLADDPSTQADPARSITVGARALLDPATGRTPQIHSDGIALDTQTHTLYWQALTGDRLYAIDSRLLTSRTAPAWQINNSVREVGRTCVADGLITDATGDLYITSLENDAVVRLRQSEAQGAIRDNKPRDFSASRLRTVIADPRLGWPDSLAIGPLAPASGPAAATGRWLYITASQIHTLKRFAGEQPQSVAGADRETTASEPGHAEGLKHGFALYRIRID